MKNNKAYNCEIINNIGMHPSDLQRSPDESFSTISKDNKLYKYHKPKNTSSLRTVTIFPGDRRVAGCFYLFSKSFGGMF